MVPHVFWKIWYITILNQQNHHSRIAICPLKTSPNSGGIYHHFEQPTKCHKIRVIHRSQILSFNNLIWASCWGDQPSVHTSCTETIHEPYTPERLTVSPWTCTGPQKEGIVFLSHHSTISRLRHGEVYSIYLPGIYTLSWFSYFMVNV